MQSKTESQKPANSPSPIRNEHYISLGLNVEFYIKHMKLLNVNNDYIVAAWYIRIYRNCLSYSILVYYVLKKWFAAKLVIFLNE